MITEAILNVFNAVVQFILGILPDVPQMPNEILNTFTVVTGLINQTIGVIAYIYTPLVLVFVLTLLVAIILFDNIYKLALWVLHKIRG